MPMRRSVRRGLLVYFVVVTAVIGVVFYAWVQKNRVDSSLYTQDQFYEWATSGPHADFGGSIGKHEVNLPPPRKEFLEILIGYGKRALHLEDAASTQGMFNLETGEIEIVGDEARLEATLPHQLRPTFYHTLRHEYGHAAFMEWLDKSGMPAEQEPYLAFTEPGEAPNPKDYPKSLAPVIAEWSSQPDSVYTLPYLSATMDEYLAESYARLLEGKSVPPVTRRFLLEHYGGKPVASQ